LLAFSALLLFGHFATAAQTPAPTEPPAAPSVAIQMPIRVCDLHDFDNSKHDPIYPVQIGAMVQGPPGDDSFYSTSQHCGSHSMGTIFKVTFPPTTAGKVAVPPTAASVTVLYNFGDGKLKDGGQIDANESHSGLSLGNDGDLYGTTAGGGKFNAGTIFKIARTGGDPQLLYSFHNGMPDAPTRGQPPPPPLSQQEKDDLAASTPWSAPLMGLDGNLYGVATTGELRNTGVLYQLSGKTFKCIHRFSNEEQSSFGLFPVSLTRGWDGNFYGTTWAGGLGFGTVFRFNPNQQSGAGGGVTTLYRFSNSPPHDEGAEAYSVIQGFDRNLYGVMSVGGPYYRGIVFQLTQDGIFNILHAFSGTDSRPGPGLVEVLQADPLQKGKREYYLYGAASWNMSIPARFNSGILYRVREHRAALALDTDPNPYGFTTVYNTEGSPGMNPSTTPVLGRDSKLYGTMADGGSIASVPSTVWTPPTTSPATPGPIQPPTARFTAKWSSWGTRTARASFMTIAFPSRSSPIWPGFRLPNPMRPKSGPATASRFGSKTFRRSPIGPGQMRSMIAPRSFSLFTGSDSIAKANPSPAWWRNGIRCTAISPAKLPVTTSTFGSRGSTTISRLLRRTRIASKPTSNARAKSIGPRRMRPSVKPLEQSKD
jgi:uncharacterized repeat protein (TIGR03803 family)